MNDTGTTQQHALPSLADMQQWTWVIGRAQQMMLEFSMDAVKQAASPATAAIPGLAETAQAQQDFWASNLALWQRFLPGAESAAAPESDRRFAAPQWRDNPMFDLIRQSYQLVCDHLLKSVDQLDSVDPKQKEQLRFATQGMLDALSPSNFAFTNPVVLEKVIETGGQNLVRGLENMLRDLAKGQLTHTDPDAFEVGRNIAVTPGKVVKETPLYQLIQYSPTTETVYRTTLVIFPPWINRFYILDLNPQKSFVRWAVEQGLTVFVVSWKSADASMKDTVWDDYVVRGQIDAIDTVRDLLDVPSVHAIGYCVAGTTLAASLAWLAANGRADAVRSATFFTTQVDFTRAGDLNLFISDDYIALIEALSAPGYLDGRYMAATFNLLRGRDLIWSYVQNNYLLGQDYAPFDLLHWNGDTTNLPAKWHKAYLSDLYRDNRLVQPGSIAIDGTPIDLGRITTPAYVQAGREDHIAPPESVWKLTEHLAGPVQFVLAGSGHIAGVVNPPAAHKYQYWLNDAAVGSLDEFSAGAREIAGSWWPHWLGWLESHEAERVEATGARIPGAGKLKAIEDAPGRYVRGQ